MRNERSARTIARDWNAAQERTGDRGFVTRFRVPADYAARYPPHAVGASWHVELWVPAEELDAFNDQIVGPIEVVVGFRGGLSGEPVESDG